MTVLIGMDAPDFTAATVMEDGTVNTEFNLKTYLDGNIGVILFYPLDFTFVCPSEIISFSNKVDKFKELNTKIIGISVDSHFSHFAWRKTPINEGGIGEIKFPLVSDLTKQISRNYGVLLNESVALRGTFLIDQEGVVRHQLVNDLPLGRNTDEAIRMVEALRFHQDNGEVCPAGWNKGDIGMVPDAKGVAEYLARNSDKL